MAKARQFVDDFREEIVAPTIHDLGMWSREAEDLLVGIAAHESGGFRHLRQSPRGPAVSPYQLEPWVAADVVVRYLDTRPDLRARLESAAWPLRSSSVDWANLDLRDLRLKLICDLRFATAVARLRLWMIPEPLPRLEDFEGGRHLSVVADALQNVQVDNSSNLEYVIALGRYWKAHWNTELGAGTVDEFVASWRAHVSWVYPSSKLGYDVPD